MMNILLMTDLEGITGVETMDMVFDTESAGYRQTVQNLADDINAAVCGFFDAGAENVYVIDGHGSGKNLDPSQLDPRAVLAHVQDITDLVVSHRVDACALVGMHAMAGTMKAFLEHTQSSKKWFDYRINGISCGELAQLAGFAGAFGIPVVMGSGDGAAEEEFRAFLGDALPFAVVKHALCRNEAVSLPADEARKLIRKCARRSVACVPEAKPYTVSLPAELTLTFQRTDYCDDAAKLYERVDSRTVRKTVEKIETYRSLLF